MPSYPDVLFRFEKKESMKHQKAALQVRPGREQGKRAYPGISASLTVEAALVLPLFLFALVLLMQPFHVMEAHRKMQDVCEEICAQAAQMAYSDPDIRKEELEDSGRNQFLHYAGTGVLGAYAAERARSEAEDAHIGLIHFLDSEYLIDGEMVRVKLEYTYRLPFPVFGLRGLDQTVVSSRRAWIGAKRSLEDEDGEGGEDPLVYVGKRSTRYHLSPSCHYLFNDLQSVPLAAIPGLRNASGGKYYPCSRCGRHAGAMVYIMPSGSAWHTREDCSAIIAYVRTVHRSEVEYLGACSYCGRE